MSIPSDAKVMTFLCTTDREKAKAFYGGVLGLKMTAEDQYAVVFETDGRMLRITPIKGFTPYQATALGWQVKDIHAAIAGLTARGVTFNIYEGFGQDAAGVWASPDGAAKIAWFSDPDGNTLSLTEF